MEPCALFVNRGGSRVYAFCWRRRLCFLGLLVFLEKMKREKGMNKRGFVVFMVVAVLIYSGCPADLEVVDSEAVDPDAVVSAISLDGLVTARVKGAAPITVFAEQPQYTGIIRWQKADGSAVSGDFEVSTVYKAVLTLTAKEGFTFTG